MRLYSISVKYAVCRTHFVESVQTDNLPSKYMAEYYVVCFSYHNLFLNDVYRATQCFYFVNWENKLLLI